MMPQIMVVDDDPIILKSAWNTLSEEEFAKIQKHPAFGGKILSNIKEMPECVSADFGWDTRKK